MSSRWLLPNVLSKCWQLFARFRLPDESLLKFCNFQLPDEELGAPVPPRGLKLHRQRGELAEGVEGAELRAPRVGPERAPRGPAAGRRAGLRSARAPGFGKLYRARSRLYRSQILQLNTRLKALAEIYTMHSFGPFSKLTFLLKNR